MNKLLNLKYIAFAFSITKVECVDKQVFLDKYSLYSDLLCFETKHYMVLL